MVGKKKVSKNFTEMEKKLSSKVIFYSKAN